MSEQDVYYHREGGTFDAIPDGVTMEQPARLDGVIVGSLELVAGGGDGTLQVDLIDSVIGLGSVFLGTPLEGLVMRGIATSISSATTTATAATARPAPTSER